MEKIFPGAEIQYRDTNPGQQVHDFDVVENLNIIAVEVTTTVQQGMRKLQKAAEKMDFKIEPKDPDKIHGTWIVHVARASKALFKRKASLEKRTPDIERCLAEFERRGVDNFNETTSWSDDKDLNSLFDKARALRIIQAKQIPSKKPQIWIFPAGSGCEEVFVSSKDYLIERIEELASRDDNRKKLAQLQT